MKMIRITSGVFGFILLAAVGAQAVPMHVTHLWHMHQPIYYPYETVRNTDANSRFNFHIESQVWDGDRYNAYRHWPAGAVGRAFGHGGSQMSYSGSLAENNSVIWGDASGWAGDVRNARNNLKTSGNNSRLDVVGIAYHHSLMPLTSVESMRMQIKLHKEQYKDVWDTGGAYSKGFWPPECAFDSSMVPALVAEGLEWVIVDNGHLFRTIEDFEWNSGSSCRPNRADVRNGTSTNLASTWVGLQNVWAPTKVLAPWSYQPHYTRHVDPYSGEVKKIIAVPAGRYEGNENGRGGYGAFKPENVWGSEMAANNNPDKPMLLLCHSDGDNYGMKNSDAWNGQQQAFVDMTASNPDFEYTSAQDYLDLYPPNVNDVIHIEPGSWIGIDGGTPYYEKWLAYEDRSGEMPDMWSWSVLVAAQNRVFTADDMENSYLSGGRDMNDVEWGIGNDTAKAWHFYLSGETSCYWYWDYDRANPWDGNVTRACNMANTEAMKVINRNPGGDSRGPSIFPPQRTPYNPGGRMWDEEDPLASDFQVWSFVDDVGGVDHATLYWRKDNDGNWPLSSTENETFAGGPGVGAWQTVAMSADWWPTQKGDVVPDASARAQRYMATIAGQTNCLIDYFVEAVDSNSNTNRSNIIHVWVGEQSGGSGGDTNPVAWIRGTFSYPADGEVTDSTPLYVNTEAGPSGTLSRVLLHYSTDSGTNWAEATMTFNSTWDSYDGQWFSSELGLFAAGTSIEYYIEAVNATSTNMDNNRGDNYLITVGSGGGGEETLWIGNTAQSPDNGTITPTNPLVISCESWPIGAATNASLVYSSDGGATWSKTPLSKTGETNNNNLWSLDVGTFADGTIFEYCVSATTSNAWQMWDNNNGANYRAIIGEVGSLHMVEHTPLISTGGSPDNPDDAFDFDTSGGAAITSGTNGFGSFGNIYVNYDETWGPSSDPQGLDNTHNAAFQPNVNVAILLGDVWGDGTHSNFNMYAGAGFDFGQGVFATPAGATTFAAVDGAVISQFGGYGPDSRLAANWEAAIPLSTFGVSNAAGLTNLYLSGLMVTGGTSNDNRYISGKYLGEDATLGNNEEPDEWGNFAFSFVNLAGLKVNGPGASTMTHGVPNSWIEGRLPSGYAFTTNSNHDGDPLGDRAEYFAGLNPSVVDHLHISGLGNGRMHFDKTGGQICNYVLQTATQLNPTSQVWNWSTHTTLSSTNGEVTLPTFSNTFLMMRVKVLIPE